MSRFYHYRRRRGKIVAQKLREFAEREKQKSVVDLEQVKRIENAQKIVKDFPSRAKGRK